MAGRITLLKCPGSANASYGKRKAGRIAAALRSQLPTSSFILVAVWVADHPVGGVQQAVAAPLEFQWRLGQVRAAVQGLVEAARLV